MAIAPIIAAVFLAMTSAAAQSAASSPAAAMPPSAPRASVPAAQAAAQATAAAPRSTTADPIAPARADRAAIESAALDDAREELRRIVAQWPIGGGQRLSELLAERGVPAQRIDELLAKAQPVAAPRWYRDGVCEVLLRLPRDCIAPAIRSWVTQAESASGGDAAAVPAASVAADLLAAGTIHAVEIEGGRPIQPWPQVGDAAAEQAAEAARLDAQRGLLERIRLLRVGDGLIVADLLADEPRIGWDLSDELPDVRFGPPAYSPDGRCLVQAAIAPADVARRIAALMRRRDGGGDLVSIESVEKLASGNAGAALRAVGLGRPHPDYARGMLPDAPAWATSCLTATGETPSATAAAAGGGGADDGGGGGAQAAAARAARFDAERGLALAIDRLELSPGRPLRTAILERADLADDLKLYLSGATPIAAVQAGPDGRVRITLGLPARRLWQIVSRPPG